MPEAVPGLVSVVMPAWNAAGTIARSIESVLGQRHAQFELLVVDDASTDATAQLVDGYAMADARVRLIRQPANGGVAAARNTGIAAARGEYVAFLDSDDWWHPAKLERQLAQMRRENAQVSYCSYQRVAEDGRVLSLVVPPREVTHAQMLRSNFIGNLTGMYARSLGNGEFLRIGHEDYVFWLQMVRRAGRAIRIEHDGPLAFYLVREGSVSSNKWRAARWQWRIYREVEGLSRVRATVCMLYYFVYALSKRR